MQRKSRSEYKRLMAIARGDIIPEHSRTQMLNPNPNPDPNPHGNPRTQMLDFSNSIMGIGSNYTGHVTQTGQVSSRISSKLGMALIQPVSNPNPP